MAGCTRKKILINLDKSDTSSFKSYFIHSRLSSASKVYERNKPQKVALTSERRSAYPLRESIWEYLNEDKKAEKFNCSSKRRARPRCKQTEEKAVENNKMWLIFLVLLVCIITMTYSRLSDFIAQSKFITKVVPKTRLISLWNSELSVEEECCFAMRNLAASLLKAEEALRNTQRVRRAMITASRTSKSIAVSTQQEKDYIEGASVKRGSDTREWGSRVALWGVLPLWRVSPPPGTVLAKRTPVPSDCWAFSGSHGEMVIELKQETEVKSISIEHIRPDTANSAPKTFVLYGALENGTRLTCIEAEYRNLGPAKQFFKVTSNTPLQKMILTVLSNHGNPKYTCVYRETPGIHGYEGVVDPGKQLEQTALHFKRKSATALSVVLKMFAGITNQGPIPQKITSVQVDKYLYGKLNNFVKS